jgi:DNA repair protein SbcC/Rad50
MRIRTVTAHAFGPLAAETMEFADGMTVVIGDNESAKSSWHAAVYAAVCGRRRVRGRPREDDQRFIDLHKPWDGDDWLVSAEVLLDDGRRIELRQDLAGRVDCHARDLAVGADISAEVMNDGSPDGARWLGLDRSSFMATACVEQAQVRQVLDGAGGLQQQLQRAADTAGADGTASAALHLITDFEREHVGSEQRNSTKPLRRALDGVSGCEQRREAARRSHDEYLRLAEDAERLRAEASRADAVVRAHEVAAAAQEAAELGDQARRAAELQAALGDTPPAPAAEDDALANQATEALTRWRNRPPEPNLAGRTAAEIQELIDALPPMPDGDLEVHASVTQAQEWLHRAEAQLAQHESDRPVAPGAVRMAAGATDQELVGLAHALETPVPVVDPELAAAAEAAHRERGSAQARSRVGAVLLAAGVVAAVAGAALLASGTSVLGAVALVAAVALALLGLARRRAGSAGDAVARHAELAARLDAARRQVAEATRTRQEAIRRCGELGLDPDPQQTGKVVTARARAASYQQELGRWQRDHAELRHTVSSAEAALLRALAARGYRAAPSQPGSLAAWVDEYRRACPRRAEQAARARQRGHLTTQLAAREDQELRAEADRQQRARAELLVTEAASACRLPVGSAETVVAGLEKWLAQRAEQMGQTDTARQQAADLAAILNGRSLHEFGRAAAAAVRRAEELAAIADPGLLAAADPATAAAQLPALREQARDASNRAADASGQLRQLADSVPSVAEAEEALEGAGSELARVRQLQQILTLTRQFLESAQDRIHHDIAPVLAATLKEWLPGITAGRYTDVSVNPSTLHVEVCGASRSWRRAELLSYGTAEQVYLLLRIALADHLTKGHDTCPLILDDVTVHADAARTDAILDLLLKIAEERQVILFTQEDQVARWARAHLTSPDHALRTLSPVPAH